MAHYSGKSGNVYNIENKDNPEDLDITWSRWKCLKCGYVYEGQQELKKWI